MRWFFVYLRFLGYGGFFLRFIFIRLDMRFYFFVLCRISFCLLVRDICFGGFFSVVLRTLVYFFGVEDFLLGSGFF